jgi:hypothetical protein
MNDFDWLHKNNRLEIVINKSVNIRKEINANADIYLYSSSIGDYS